MPNHPNRSRVNPSPSRTPRPEEIRAWRERAGLTTLEAARLCHATATAFALYEAGVRRMHPALWELCQLKSNPRYGIKPL